MSTVLQSWMLDHVMKRVVALAVAAIGCGDPAVAPDAGPDAGIDAGPDAEIRFPSAEPPDLASAPCTGTLGFPGLPSVAVDHQDLRVGDVNGDGKPDVVYRNYTTFSIVLGRGDGTFAPPVSFMFANGLAVAYGFFLADLNGDGKLDLGAVFHNSAPLTFQIDMLLNDGAGGFTPWRTASGLQVDADDLNDSGGLKIALSAADLNADGTLDLVAMGGSKLRVWLSTPTAYDSLQTYAIGTGAVQMAPGDVTEDGRPDVVVSSSGGVSVLANTGTGALAARVVIASPVTAGGVALVDLNEDGKRDIVFGDNDATGKNVGVSLNQGAGVFGTATRYPADLLGTSSSLVTADFNGDGHQDIVVGRGPGGVLDGTGTGSLASARPWNVGISNPSDVNGDGRTDVLADYNLGGFSVLLNNGTASPFESFDLHTVGTREFSRGARWTDLNDDGLLDLVGIGVDESNVGSVTTRLGVSGGDFSPQSTTYPSIAPIRTNDSHLPPELPNTTAVADVDNDNRQDVILMGGASVQTLLDKGDGTISVVTASPGGNGGTIVVGDFDRDGFRDLVLPGRYTFLGGPFPDPVVTYRRGLGNGEFATGSVIWQGPGSIAAAALDVNSDGKLDLVVEQYNVLNILLGHGDGTFAAPVLATGAAGFPIVLVAHDVNADGRPDLVRSTLGGFSTSLNNGNGTFGVAISSPGGHQWPAFADFNGDGHVDIVSQSNLGVDISLGRGDGAFDASLSYPAPGHYAGVVSTGDVDGDGRVDILVEGYKSDVGVLRGRCL